MRNTFRLGFILIFLIISSIGFAENEAISKKPKENDFNEKDVSKLLMLGIYGKNLNKLNQRKLQKVRPGGIILFGANVSSYSQLKKLVQDIYSLYDNMKEDRPFIAIDQEGGNVTRIKTYPRMPAPSLFGKGVKPDQIRNVAYFNSKLLRSLGINMNFSPVLDIQPIGGNDFLGARTYSSNPYTVGNISERVIEGANEAYVISTAKHFPGHGDLVGDSHKILPFSHKTLNELKKKELIPYYQIINQNKIPAIMVGHIGLPKVIQGEEPASFSSEINTNLLRKELKFKGIILTDDIQMQGAKIDPDPGKRAELAIRSGVDLVMIAWNRKAQYKAYNHLLKTYRKDPKFRSVVHQSLKRLKDAKKTFHILGKESNPKSLKQINTNKQMLEIEITKLFDQRGYRKKHLSFLQKNQSSIDKPVVVLSKYKSFYKNLKSNAPNRRLIFFQLNKGFSNSKLKAVFDKYPESIFYFQASSKKHLDMLKNIKPTTLEKTFVINGADRNYISNYSNIYTGTTLPELGIYLADMKNEKRDIANAKSHNKKQNQKEN
ncbi:MAG: beta-N-acetylhexosaminidase [Bdellovibrionota bacterium]|nr:beta-N-acetylhexosaminidase [Bdellovibrionota bacterium]